MAVHHFFQPPWWLRWWRICRQCGRPGFDLWSEKSPGKGNDKPLQYSCMENSMIRRALQSTIHGIPQTRLKGQHLIHFGMCMLLQIILSLICILWPVISIFSFWNSNRVINIGFINGIIKWILGLNQSHIWWLGCSHYQVKKRHWIRMIHNMKMILSLMIWSGGKDSEIRGHSTTVTIKNVFAVVIQLLTYVWLSASPWTTAWQASLSFTIFQSLLKFMSIESVMLYNHLAICHLLLLP